MKLIVDAVSVPAVRLLFVAVLAIFAVGCSSSDAEPLLTEIPDDLDDPDDPIDGEPGETLLCDGDSNVSGGFLTGWSDNCTLNFENSDGSPGPYANSSYTQGVQRILWCLGYDEGEPDMDTFADGVFGRNTENAVKAWQTDEGLVSDGIVGENSWSRLQELLLGPNEFDLDTNWYAVDSDRCVGQIQFYQETTGNMAWMMESTPADVDGDIVMVPFSIDAP